MEKNKKYTIKEAAKLCGLSLKMIRDYEKKGLIQAIFRSDTNYRIYNKQNISNLIFIRNAKILGFSLNEIKTLLELKENHHRKSAEVNQFVQKHIQMIELKISELSNIKNQLKIWSKNCQNNEQKECAILDGIMQKLQ